MEIKKIHHIAIICSDYEKSKYFYTKILGFPIINETFRAHRNSYKLDLRVGNNDMIELFSFPSPAPRSHPENCGLRHQPFQGGQMNYQGFISVFARSPRSRSAPAKLTAKLELSITNQEKFI